MARSGQQLDVSRGSASSVAVLIPCHNYGRFLDQCVASVLAQHGVEVEILVVDDASTDDSLDVATALSRQDKRVRVLALDRNVGMVTAVNQGLAELGGDYLVKLDADDLLTPGSLLRSATLLDDNPEVGFVYGPPRHFSTAAPPLAGPSHPQWLVWPGADWFAMRYRRAVNCISQPEAAIRMSTLRKVGLYNPALSHTADLEMWLRLAAAADVGRINGVYQGYYRVHAASMQRTVNAGVGTDLLGRRAAFLNALTTADALRPDAARLETTVRAALASQALDRACRAYDRDKVDPVIIQQMVDFAVETCPGARSLPRWAALERRRRRGTTNRWSPPALTAATTRRVAEEWARHRWLRTGL